jgi:hypothetical protein
MVIRKRENQYQGINPHLMSVLQTPGTDDSPSSWLGFHNHYISRVMEALNAQLPEGYIAVNEQSLQVLGEDDGGEPIRRKPVPDISVYGQSRASSQGAVSAVADPTWETTVDAMLEPEHPADAVIIYERAPHKTWGNLVARIELLSRSNKPGGQNFAAYRLKRQETLAGRTILVEIDFLHESASPISDLPVYPREAKSHPYYVAVSDARVSRGPVKVYGFDVDQPIQAVPIPLIGKDQIAFNFGEPYHHAYQLGPWHTVVDYEDEPARFYTYSEADQQRIRARMAAVMVIAARE